MSEKQTWFSSSVTKSLSENDQLKVAEILTKIDTFDFDIFELNSVIQNKILFYIANSIFIMMEIDYMLEKDKWINFITGIIKGYDRSICKYHNDIHAANVFQTCFVLLFKGNLKQKLYLRDLDIFSFLLATICHDFKHPGVSNNYLFYTNDELTITYNGKLFKFLK